jgi:hypothetical protein
MSARDGLNQVVTVLEIINKRLIWARVGLEESEESVENHYNIVIVGQLVENNKMALALLLELLTKEGRMYDAKSPWPQA